MTLDFQPPHLGSAQDDADAFERQAQMLQEHG
jgi:hypothetical protein